MNILIKFQSETRSEQRDFIIFWHSNGTKIINHIRRKMRLSGNNFVRVAQYVCNCSLYFAHFCCQEQRLLRPKGEI